MATRWADKQKAPDDIHIVRGLIIVLRYRVSRSYALNLAGLKALGAHADSTILAIYRSMYGLKIRSESTLIANM